jgi:hypothetical protein
MYGGRVEAGKILAGFPLYPSTLPHVELVEVPFEVTGPDGGVPTFKLYITVPSGGEGCRLSGRLGLGAAVPDGRFTYAI